MTMNGWERKREIMRLAEENGYVKVDYLARVLHISASSIRRDLLSLEANGEIRRTYGGAEPARGGSRLIPYDLRAHQNEGRKRTVASLASSLVSDGDVVFLDGSSTAFYLVDHLSRLHGVTVVTNGLSTALALSGTQVRLLSTGGRPNPENPSALVGSHAEELIAGMHADVVFFSAQSLSSDGEITDCFEEEIALRRLMCRRAARRVFLCDGSKLGKTSSYTLGNLGEVDAVVCDLPAPDGLLDAFPSLVWLDRPLSHRGDSTNSQKQSALFGEK